MLGRGMLCVTKAALAAAAFLVAVPPLCAGDRVRASDRSTTPSQPASAPVARPLPLSARIAVVVSPSPQPPREQVYVDLRGPDGQMRRFPVEGGPTAIQTPQVMVLRPGQSVTIQWVAAK